MQKTATEISTRPNTDGDVVVARQPIYNNRMGVFGYELLFRPRGGGHGGLKPTEATAQVLASTIFDFRLNELAHNRKIVINVTRAFVDVIAEVQLPPGQVVLDLPDNLATDPDLFETLEQLQGMGYRVSIGGMANLRNRELLPLADIFRIDVRRIDVSRLDALIAFLRRFDNLALQALKIETMEEYTFYRDRGFDYLQGYFLSRPRVYVSRDLTANKLALLQLLAMVQSPDTPIAKLEQQIMSDVSLSYKLLKLVNAPFFGVAQGVESIQRAIVLLGRDEIRKWVSLLVLSGMKDSPAAILELAVMRGKMCELLARKAGLPKDGFFTVGMFSVLDILMKQPIKAIMAKLPLSDSIKDAILGQQGTMGHALACTLAMENAQWSEIGFARLEPSDVYDAYRQAVQGTQDILAQF